MLPDPTLNVLLNDHKLMKNIYEALDEDDTSAAVITALQILRRLGIRQLKHQSKCEKSSEAFRKKGNDSLSLDRHQEAMEYYNKALMFAPNNSRAMKLTYGNRSYVFFKTNKFKACIKDIKMALAIPTARDIDVKLKVRLQDAMKYEEVETIMRHQSNAIHGPSFFKIEKPNPDIPCASSDVGMVKERQVPKLIAKNDIKVGTVLAIEEAFSLVLSDINQLNSCYYCFKKSLNLIPCDGCCCVLFCNPKCHQYSLNEGHSIECQIMEIVNLFSSDSISYLSIKSTLKIREQCKNWEEFIEASHSVGHDRSRKSSIKEICDSTEKFSLLCSNDDRLFIHGKMVNVCFPFATILLYLETVKNFLPDDETKKREAIRALARVMIFLNVYTIPTTINQLVTTVNPPETCVAEAFNVGCFSLLGKLRHSCFPNVLAINLNRKMVLVASRPIEAGTPLTVHYLGAHMRSGNSMNNAKLYSTFGIVCNCIVCTGKNKSKMTEPLNKETERKLEELNFPHLMENIYKNDLPKIYPTICEMMAVLKDVPHSVEYHFAIDILIKCLEYFADHECQNIMLDCLKLENNSEN